MPAVNQMLLASGNRNSLTFSGAIIAAALTSNLQLVLDAGDSASYTSGQSWLDRSGNGFDFFLGANGSGGADDPVFNGIAGSPSAYWSFDGSQYFTYDTTNETWMQNIHKDNALFSFVFFYRSGTTIDNAILASTNDSTGTGFFLYGGPNGGLRFEVANAGVVVKTVSSDAGPPGATWHMMGVSVNEATGAGGGFFYLDGNYYQVGAANTWNSTYTSPAAGNATNTMTLACLGAAVTPTPSGSRFGCLAAWSTALSKENMDTIWTAMRGRFGI